MEFTAHAVGKLIAGVLLRVTIFVMVFARASMRQVK